MRKHLTGILIAWMMLLGACQAEPTTTPQAQASPTITPTPPFSPADLTDAYAITEPDARRAAVLRATEAFLERPSTRTLPDSEIADIYTDLVSEQVDLPGPARIFTDGDRTVVNLMDGMGMYLFTPEQPPLLLSQWTMTTIGVQPIWAPQRVGVSYVTAAIDGTTYLHFVLAEQVDGVWGVHWHSDDDPRWWINARNGRMSATDDLLELTVIGEAVDTSIVFDELNSDLHRTLAVYWLRVPDGYRPVPRPEGYSTRSEWLWQVAAPSPYNTLIEFMERLRGNSSLDAARLTTGPDVMDAAFDFGLYLPDRRYTVTDYVTRRITFRDSAGAFVIRFQEPQEEGDQWLIQSITPLGAE